MAIGTLLVVGPLWVLSASSSVNFEPFFGTLPPPAAAAVACLLGIASLSVLQRRFGFCVAGGDTGARGPLVAVALALPFMVTVTAVDLLVGFPADTHTDLPVALVFYPLMGLIAQLVLHIVPFTLLLSAFSRLFIAWPVRLRIWLAVILSASVEAGFQASGSTVPGDGLTLLSAVVAMHVFVFGLTELYLFWRFDFISIYIFRLTYYGYWHILWGSVFR